MPLKHGTDPVLGSTILRTVATSELKEECLEVSTTSTASIPSSVDSLKVSLSKQNPSMGLMTKSAPAEWERL